jgi:hypothetical protein
MLQGNLTKGIKKIITDIAENVIKDAIQRQFDWNMQNIPDPTIKGDIQITLRGPIAEMAKEQNLVKRQEFLDRTNNDLDMSIIGIEGRANVLRETAKSLDLTIDEVIPPQEELQRKLQVEQEQTIPLEPEEAPPVEEGVQ